jgi:hypothetical protein
MGVPQAGNCLGLGAETGQLVRAGVGPAPDHLQGHRAAQAALPGPVDHAHATPAQLLEKLITGHGRQAGRSLGTTIGEHYGRVPKQGGQRQVREADAVLLRLGVIAGLPAVVNLEGDQLAQEGGPVRLRRVAQVVFDAGPLPRLPGQLEAVTGLVDPPGRRERPGPLTQRG